MSEYFEEIIEEDDSDEEYFDMSSIEASFQELHPAAKEGKVSYKKEDDATQKQNFEQLIGKAHWNDDDNDFDESFIEYEEELVEEVVKEIVSPKSSKKTKMDEGKSPRISGKKKLDEPKSPKTPRKSSRKSVKESLSALELKSPKSPKTPKTPRKSSRKSMKESLSELEKKSSKSPKMKSPRPKKIKKLEESLGESLSELELKSPKTPKTRKSTRKSKLEENLSKSISELELKSPKSSSSRKSLKKEVSERSLGKNTKRTPRSSTRKTLAAPDLNSSLSLLKSPKSSKKKVPGDKPMKRRKSDSNLKEAKSERRKKNPKAPYSPGSRRKKLEYDEDMMAVLLDIGKSDLGDGKKKERKTKDKSRVEKNLAKFEAFIGKANANEIGSDDDFDEEEIIEDKNDIESEARKQNNLAKFEQLLGDTGEEVIEEEVIEEETSQRISSKSASMGRKLGHGSLDHNSLSFEQLLMKVHGIDEDVEEYEYEEIVEDPGTTNRDSMAFKTVSMSRRALMSKDNEECSTIQQSFRVLHKSRRAAMMDLKTSVPRQITAKVEKENHVNDQSDDDDEWEEQVIEKWFRRDSLPDDLAAACIELIPIVYKGEDVSADTMMRRTPLKELYAYLKQHLDYKQMKATQNLNRFEQLFDSSMNVSYGNLATHEETVEVDEDIFNLSSHAMDKKSRRSERKGRSKQSNEDVFEDLLRRAHGADDSDSDDEDEFYEEEEVIEVPSTKEDQKMDKLAMFENLMGNYEEEVL
jgi:hypothetical protein